MAGIFVVQGWSEAARMVVEAVVAADDDEAAKARALSDGLTVVTVRPYAPVEPADRRQPTGPEQPVAADPPK